MVSFISTFFPTVQGGVVGTAGLAWDHERKELGRGGGGGLLRNTNADAILTLEQIAFS